jgi:type IV secretory pathway TraG/TraD family ATPase VirD4
LTTIAESLAANDRHGGEDAAFFAKQNDRMIGKAIDALLFAQGTVSGPDLEAFISSYAESPESIKSPQWRSGFQNQMLQAAFCTPKSKEDNDDFERVKNYWLSEIPKMAPKTRSSIQTGVMGLLETFNTGIVRQLISTSTNVTVDDMLLRRKWLMISVPPSRYGSIGTFINVAFKYLAQRFVLARQAMSGDPIHVCWCDEASQFANSFDAQYITECRSHLGCLVFLTQSLHSYLDAFKGPTGAHQAKSLLGNLSHHVVHALGDIESAEWASALTGKRLETFIGGSMQSGLDIYEQLMGQQQFSGTFNTSYEPEVKPWAFMSGLRCGGKQNGYMADAYVIRTGEKFSNGKNFLRVEFSQSCTF